MSSSIVLIVQPVECSSSNGSQPEFWSENYQSVVQTIIQVGTL